MEKSESHPELSDYWINEWQDKPEDELADMWSDLEKTDCATESEYVAKDLALYELLGWL